MPIVRKEVSRVLSMAITKSKRGEAAAKAAVSVETNLLVFIVADAAVMNRICSLLL